MTKPIRSDGGSTSYYDLPPGAKDIGDLIEHKNMSFNLGNIFKACYRLGSKEGTEILYDINKIIYFANRIKRQVENESESIPDASDVFRNFPR